MKKQTTENKKQPPTGPRKKQLLLLKGNNFFYTLLFAGHHLSFGKKNVLLRRKFSFPLFIFWCLFSTKLFSQSPQELFNAANNYYQQNEYQQAAALYEKIIALGYESAEVYYNLGNCYFKLNEVGRSVLNYERALKLAPDQEDILFNLKLANLRVADRIEPMPQMLLIRWAKNVLSAFSADGWAMGSVAFLWAAIISFSVYLFVIKPFWRQLSFFSGVLLLFFSILFLLIAWRQQHYEKSHRFGVVMVTNTYIKSAPALQATDLFILREGVKAEILETANGWQKIKLADGKVGWIQQDHIEII